MNGALSKKLRSNTLILTHFALCEILRCEIFRIKFSSIKRLMKAGYVIRVIVKKWVREPSLTHIIFNLL